MSRPTVFAVTLTILLIAPALLAADESLSLSAAMESIAKKDLRRHVDTLADDALEGREAGSRGGYAAAKYLQSEFVRLGLKPAGEDSSYVQLFNNGYRNLLGMLPGSDEKLRDEVIVICAHYDHVGYGSNRNSRGPIGYIHNGADDNASGTSAVLEIAEAFSKLAKPPKRSILFAFWDGEEGGLLGSRNWVADPTIDRQRIKRVVNIDMLGRLRDQGLEVLGTRTVPGSRRLVAEQNVDTALPLKFTWRTKANSDHYPFFEQGIPYLLFHTGLHDDYHRPSDDVDKVNVPGLEKCSRLVFLAAHQLAEAKTLGAFRSNAQYEALYAQQQHEQAIEPVPSRLGVRWNVEQPQGGLLLTQVNYDSAAAEAGLQSGDRIVEFAEKKIEHGDRETAEIFRAAVMKAERELKLRVIRPGEKEPLAITAKLRGKPIRIGISWRSDSAEPGVATIVRVVPGSPAARADLRVTDRIYTAGGKRLETIGQLGTILKAAKESVDLVVERRGQLRTVTVTGI
jgi:hypothetical protein